MSIRCLVPRFVPAVTLVLSLGFLDVGCAQQKAWLYSVDRESSNPIVLDRSVAVPPFSDKRSNRNSNMLLMYMLPLMPFGWQDFGAPEGSSIHVTSGLWLWKPNEDMAKAAAEELENAHVFKEAFFTNRRSEGDLILKGTIDSCQYDGKLLSYGLSVYGPLLWLVGIPAAHVRNTLEVSFSLEDPKNGRVLWQKAYSAETSNLSWLYYMASDFNYSELFKGIMRQVITDLPYGLRRRSR